MPHGPLRVRTTMVRERPRWCENGSRYYPIYLNHRVASSVVADHHVEQIRLRNEDVGLRVTSRRNLPEGVITIAFFILLKNFKKGNTDEIQTPESRVEYCLIVTADNRQVAGNDFAGVRIQNDNFAWIPRHNKQAMIRFVKRHRTIVAALLSDGPSRDNFPFLAVNHPHRSLGVKIYKETGPRFFDGHGFYAVAIDLDVSQLLAGRCVDHANKAKVFVVVFPPIAHVK